MNTCRLCKNDSGALIKYGVRHYAHAACGLEKWGSSFFDRLSKTAMENFPYLIAKRLGFAKELERRAQDAKAAA